MIGLIIFRSVLIYEVCRISLTKILDCDFVWHPISCYECDIVSMSGKLLFFVGLHILLFIIMP